MLLDSAAQPSVPSGMVYHPRSVIRFEGSEVEPDLMIRHPYPGSDANWDDSLTPRDGGTLAPSASSTTTQGFPSTGSSMLMGGTFAWCALRTARRW